MSEDRLLTALREHPGAFLSGEQLSRASGISRAAIWKQIEKLREEGYEIAAQPHLGYQFVAPPDRLIPEELSWGLKTAVVGRRISSYARTDSTMEIAHRLAAAGEPEGHAVFAEAQTRGRGRLGRTWRSPAGQGVYLSVLLRPKLAPADAPLLTVLAAVALVEAIREGAGLEARIKWPNDVLIGERKVSGILTELQSELGQVHAAVLGIGLNVNTPRSALPKFATSLALARGERCDRLAVARALLAALDRWYVELTRRGAGRLLTAWQAASMTLGRRVRVACQDRSVDGEAAGVGPAGALLVRTDTGRMETVTAGEVLILR
ncbi:MAG: biotin--[acetyl-CoA-carboxylase] ligase [Candidatus Omnitrophica bacterium]|nr:biotin--[acetyl-CoA-carboxylase] ligase [Candidatus Omnitrophota bacterium]